jgi:hypothetical protein
MTNLDKKLSCKPRLLKLALSKLLQRLQRQQKPLKKPRPLLQRDSPKSKHTSLNLITSWYEVIRCLIIPFRFSSCSLITFQSMGFPLEESLAALRVCGFVPELALDFLISRAISKAAPADGHAQAGGAARAPPGDMDFQMFLQHREQREAAAPLMAMGFQEQDVIAAMQEFAGNMDAALNHLVEAAAIGAISIDPSAAAYVPRGAGASRSPSPPPPPVSLPSGMFPSFFFCSFLQFPGVPQ